MEPRLSTLGSPKPRVFVEKCLVDLNLAIEHLRSDSRRGKLSMSLIVSALIDSGGRNRLILSS